MIHTSRRRVTIAVAASALLGLAATQPTTHATDDDMFEVDGEAIIDRATYDAALEEGTLTLYTTGTEDSQNAINAAFTADTGIEVQYFRGPGAEMTQRVLAETSGGVFEFDVVGLTSPGDMITLKNEGLLAEFEMDIAELLLVPEEIDDDHAYYPLYAWLYVIGVNRGALGDDVVVETWDDILREEFHGLLGITPAGVGGTGLAQASFQREVLGEDYWTRLGAADPVIFTSTSTVAQGLARGEIVVAVLAESAAAPHVASGAPVELVYPEAGVIGGVSYQAVAERAPHPNAARVFQAWSMSLAGQNAVAEAGARPVRPEANDAQIEGADLPGQADITIWWSDLRTRLDTAPELIAAWNEAVGYTE